MRALRVFFAVALVVPFCQRDTAFAADEPQPPSSAPRAGISVWDTGRSSPAPLEPAALAGRNEWTAIASGKTADSLQGDAVVSNGRIVAVLRKQDATLEIHAADRGGTPPRIRLRLLTAAGEPAARLARAAVIENSRAGAGLEATFLTAQGAELTGRFRIKRGEVTVQAEPGAGAGKLRVECPGRFAVLPDFFADDLTIDATKLPLDAAELPSENFVLHLGSGGDSIAMCVFENRQQDVRVTLAGTGDRRIITGSETGFEGKQIWVALLEAPGIWHTRDLAASDTGKVLPLEWRMPFPAQWRVDFTRSNELTDSWEMLLQEHPSGPYTKPSWLGSGEGQIPPDRRRWNTVLGTFAYPCWSDPAGNGYLQPIKSRVLQVRGPVLIFPINRVAQTPLELYTVVDIMRNTLGVGPCQHILDIEGQKSEYRGRATCSVRDTITPIYERRRQKEQRSDIEAALDEGLVFVKHIRGRIIQYVAFGKDLRRYLDEQKRAHPELSEFIGEMDRLATEIDDRVAARSGKIKTPEDVARMNDEFRKEVLDHDDSDALKRCQAYARALVEIGGNQDELVGECRYVVRALRQRAGVLIALDPRVAPIAAEIRTRAQDVLRNPSSHEGARH
jgi:hypothetical protein